MTISSKLSRLAGAAAISAALILPAASANADQRGNTLLGAGAGAVAGGLLTHGSPAGIIGGAVVGGVAGHVLSHHHHYHHRYCHHHYC
ncbi:MAG TPA: osmotically-inducible lipoprotein B [Caulobacteraceae bacterium]|jgi:osmotically inducible lipoprotein OsmB|nr:osmotically-inducible lipoprotein B [Caulobacteraceae bacterium]